MDILGGGCKESMIIGVEGNYLLISVFREKTPLCRADPNRVRNNDNSELCY